MGLFAYIHLKKAGFALFCLSLLSLLAFTGKDSALTPEEFCRSLVIRNIDGIITELDNSNRFISNRKTVVSEQELVKFIHGSLVTQYRSARQKYKEIEFFIEYYSPFDAKFYINGPLVPKVEMEISNVPFDPHGFQVLEENLFDKSKTNVETLQNEYILLISRFKALREQYSGMRLERNKIEEALQLQMIRIMCLTLNGYDCTINKETTAETVNALNGPEQILRSTEHTGMSNKQEMALKAVIRSIQRCKKTLQRHKRSDSFDRLSFMIENLDPAYTSLLDYFRTLNTEPSSINYAVNFKAGSFFNHNSIHRQYFSVYISDTLQLNEQAELGQLLFYDPVLSGNNKRACASCHRADKGFADGVDKSTAFDGQRKITRNAPTVINAAYQKLFFHDGRIFNIEEQANSVFNNAFEMNITDAEIISKLKQSDEYRLLFKRAFKGRYDTAITGYAIIKSITEFIKKLDSRNSRFDRYLKGDKNQLTGSEKNGYNLFAGKALCGSCHFFPLFNGTVPPMYNDNEFEVIGVPQHADNKAVDPDKGREAVTHSAIHQHAFKTPGLRNIELTAPYMHNGVYNSLDSVLAFYNRGGGAGVGLKVENQTLPFDSLGLTKKELGDLKAFLISLTDVSQLPKPPAKLPQFENEALNKRKIGGEY